MSAAGLGSDSGGSVRVPAHFTGICSMKPTPGRIPGRGHLPPCVGPFSTLGAIGPMARTMGDVALMFRTLSGQDPHDPASPPIALREPSFDELRTNTIGFFEDDGLVPVTPETRAAVQAAAAALRDSGFRVEPFRPGTLELLRKLWWTFFVQCGAMFYEPAIRGKRGQLSPIFKEFLGFSEALPPLTATELLDAWAELDLLRSKTLAELSAYPVLLCFALWPAFPPSATGNVCGPSRGGRWVILTPCATRSGLTCSPARGLWCRWAGRRKDSRLGCRLWRGPSRMRRRLASLP
jgi:amidase